MVIQFPVPPEWASVNLAEVAGSDMRLDASAYNIWVRRARETVNNCGWPVVPLPQLTTNIVPPSRYRSVYAEKGMKNTEPFFLPSQINDIVTEPVKWIYPEAMTVDIASLRTEARQILLSRSGTTGECAYVSTNKAGKIFSGDLIRITADTPGYIYAFLKSKTGRALVTGQIYGGVVDHINPNHLNAVPVPNPPRALRKKIHAIVEESYQLLDQSNDLIEKARTMLLEALQLPSVESLKKTAPMFKSGATAQNFSVPLGKWETRLDASYHLPIVGKIMKALAKSPAEITTVSDERISEKIIMLGRFERVYVDEGHGVPFIGGKQIHQLDPNNKKYLSRIEHEALIESNLHLQEGMTLITCSGSVGKVSIVGRHWEKFAANQHIIRVVPASRNIAGYVYAWLSSNYAQPLITRWIYGAVIDEINDSQVGRIPMPFLADAPMRRKINDMVLSANEKRAKSYEAQQAALDVFNKEVFQIS